MGLSVRLVDKDDDKDAKEGAAKSNGTPSLMTSSCFTATPGRPFGRGKGIYDSGPPAVKVESCSHELRRGILEEPEVDVAGR